MLLKRRELLKGAALSLAAAVIPKYARAEKHVPMPARILGRTGLQVSALGYGAMQVSDPAIIRYGLDRGITYIDTAASYLGGRNEKVVGEAITGIRDDITIATKVQMSSESRMRRSVDRSLASLKVETIDLMQLHGLSSPDQVIDQDVKKTMARMKKESKFRFTAVATHSNQARVLEAVLEDGFYDAVLIAVNFRSPRKLFAIIEQAASEGVGIIAMKTQNGGYDDSAWPEFTPHQAALRFVIEKPGVHLAVPGMLSRNMIDENREAVTQNGGLADFTNLETYQTSLHGKACAFCSQCIEQCPFRTGGLDAVRIVMYADGYGDHGLASSNAAEARANISRCLSCAGCVVECSQGIDIKAAAQRASLFVS